MIKETARVTSLGVHIGANYIRPKSVGFLCTRVTSKHENDLYFPRYSTSDGKKLLCIRGVCTIENTAPITRSMSV